MISGLIMEALGYHDLPEIRSSRAPGAPLARLLLTSQTIRGARDLIIGMTTSLTHIRVGHRGALP